MILERFQSWLYNFTYLAIDKYRAVSPFLTDVIDEPFSCTSNQPRANEVVEAETSFCFHLIAKVTLSATYETGSHSGTVDVLWFQASSFWISEVEQQDTHPEFKIIRTE